MGSKYLLSRSVSMEYKETILLPYSYVENLPGKNLREKLAKCFNYWLQVPEKTFKSVCKIIGMLHVASLVIDDIEDGSDLRRGFPAAHKVFGVPFAINAANYAYVDALQEVINLGSREAVKIYANQMIALHQGQGMEIYWRDCVSKKQPTEVHYEETMIKKTSGLFHMMVQLLQNESVEENRDFTKLVTLISLYFQIRDDLQNLCSKQYEDSKGFCEDITEGKFSFPVIHAINSENSTRTQRILEILKLHTDDVDLKKEVLKLLEDCGSIKYTKEKLANLKLEIGQEIDDLGGNPSLEVFLNKFLLY